MTPPPLSWLRARVRRSRGCWNWTGYVDKDGYGRVNTVPFGGTQKGCGAHRVAYLIVHGAIPAGHDIDHLCHNRRCVAPDHLAAALPSANRSRQRHNRGNNCLNGHPLPPAGPDGRRRCKPCHNERAKQSRLRRGTRS